PESFRTVDVSSTLATERQTIIERRHPVYQAMLRLVVNALCYLVAYPDDIDTVWPERTPDALKKSFLFGQGKERMRAKSKLAELGYVPVHVCGKRFAEELAARG